MSSEKSQGLFATLPSSLKQECLVRTKEQDPDRLKEHQETVKTKSVAQLSSVTGFSDIPVPAPIERLFDPSKRAKSKERSR